MLLTLEFRHMLVNCAGSLLMLVVFCAFVLLTAGAIIVLRALLAARREARPRMVTASRVAWRTAERARQSASAVVEPQLRLAGWWAGLGAGFRALVKTDGRARGAHGLPSPPAPGNPAAEDADREGRPGG